MGGKRVRVRRQKAVLADFFEVFEGFRTEFKVQFVGSEGGFGTAIRKSGRYGDRGGRCRLFWGCFGRWFGRGRDLLAEVLRFEPNFGVLSLFLCLYKLVVGPVEGQTS